MTNIDHRHTVILTAICQRPYIEGPPPLLRHKHCNLIFHNQNIYLESFVALNTDFTDLIISLYIIKELPLVIGKLSKCLKTIHISIIYLNIV